MQSPPDYTPKGYVKVNKLLFSALFMGVVVISIVMLATTPNQSFHTDFNNGQFMMIAPIICVVGLGMSRGVFNHFVKQAKRKDSLKSKLNQYRVALIIGLALCEFPAMFANIAFMSEGNQFYVLLAIVCGLLMLTYFPSDKKIIKDLDLRGDDLEKFQDKNTKIRE